MNWIDKVAHPADLLNAHWQEIGNRHGKDKDFSIDFLPELNNKIWGLRRRNLVVVAGRPSQGKSTLMLNMAYSFAKQGKKVFFFSLEMTKEECLERLICNYCSIENIHLHTGNVHNKKYMERVAAFHKELKDINLMIIESWGKNFSEIMEVMDEFVDPDVVFIDYVNMIRQGSRNKKDAIDEYIKELRTLALNKNFCAVLGAQINREVHRNQDPSKEVSVPNMWNLKESGNLEEIADLVLIVHWPHYYRFISEGEISDGSREYIIKIAKNRSGRTGVFIGDFLPEFYRITSREKISNENNRGID